PLVPGDHDVADVGGVALLDRELDVDRGVARRLRRLDAHEQIALLTVDAVSVALRPVDAREVVDVARLRAPDLLEVGRRHDLAAGPLHLADAVRAAFVDRDLELQSPRLAAGQELAVHDLHVAVAVVVVPAFELVLVLGDVLVLDLPAAQETFLLRLHDLAQSLLGKRGPAGELDRLDLDLLAFADHEPDAHLARAGGGVGQRVDRDLRVAVVLIDLEQRVDLCVDLDGGVALSHVDEELLAQILFLLLALAGELDLRDARALAHVD